MRPHPSLTTLRFIGLAIGFLLFAFMAYRAGETANSRTAVQGVPHIAATTAADTEGPIIVSAPGTGSYHTATPMPVPVVQAVQFPNSQEDTTATADTAPATPAASDDKTPPGQLKKQSNAAPNMNSKDRQAAAQSTD